MQLPDEASTTVKSNLDGLNVGGYTVSLADFKLNNFDGKKLSLSFNYKLGKSEGLLPELTDKRHKLVMEVVDSKQKYEQAYDLGVDGETSSWKLGTDTATFEGTSTDYIAIRMNESQSYKVNVYAEFDGHRKLLASTSYGWYDNLNK